MFSNKQKTASALTVAAALTAGAAFGGDLRTGVVNTHPSQGDVEIVDGGTARLDADAEGIFVNMESVGLTPGHIHTLWFVAINAPEACEGAPCTTKDVLKNTSQVQADVGYLDGILVGPEGTASFNGFQAVGPLQGAWFSDGLKGTDGVEVHLVVNDHGPMIEGIVGEMLTTYRAGCTDESIPKPMPASARRQGTPGPNACRLVQFSIFQPEDIQS